MTKFLRAGLSFMLIVAVLLTVVSAASAQTYHGFMDTYMLEMSTDTNKSNAHSEWNTITGGFDALKDYVEYLSELSNPNWDPEEVENFENAIDRAFTLCQGLSLFTANFNSNINGNPRLDMADYYDASGDAYMGAGNQWDNAWNSYTLANTNYNMVHPEYDDYVELQSWAVYMYNLLQNP